MDSKEMIKYINNIIWHIETNRKVCGDKSTLDAVLKSLKSINEEYNK